MLHQILKLLQVPSSEAYRRAQPLILVNGLAEQGESWYLNRSVWQQHYDVHAPEFSFMMARSCRIGWPGGSPLTSTS